MPVESFGPSSRGPVQKFVLGSPPGPVLEVLDLGATVHRLWLTGGDGVRRNVVLGHATADEYLSSKDYVGGTIGRYANRIRGARFELDGEAVQLAANEHGNQLHGGPVGFDKVMWRVEEHNDDQLVLELTSPHGDQGFPGELIVVARFAVAEDTVRLTLEATTDTPTVVGLTSHTYLNLDGDGAGPVSDQLLRVAADELVSTDDDGIPGRLAPVEGSPFDLRTPRALGEVSDVDHCFAVAGDGLRVAAVLDSPATRTRAVLLINQPGLQVYAGKGFDDSSSSTAGSPYGPGAGVALEPGPFPDTPNRPDFGSAELRPGETYRSQIEWRFEPTV